MMNRRTKKASEHIVSRRAFPLLSIFSVAAPSVCILVFVLLHLLGSTHATPAAVISLFLTLGSGITAAVGLIFGERPRVFAVTALLFNLALLSLGLYILARALDFE
jgi:hypothetical protein